MSTPPTSTPDSSMSFGLDGNVMITRGPLATGAAIFGGVGHITVGSHTACGTHVAIGVLWLTLMYVRSFKPASGSTQRSWFTYQLGHVVAIALALLLSLKLVLGLVHALQVEPTIGAGIGTFFSHDYGYLVGFLAAVGACFWFARPRGPVRAPPVRHARGPDPVRELCVSRT